MQRRQFGALDLRRLIFRHRHTADPEDHALDIFIGPAKAAEILATHHRFRLFHPLLAEPAFEQLRHFHRKFRAVVGGRCEFRLAQGHDRHPVLRHAGSNRLTARNPLDAVEQLGPRIVAIAAHGQQQQRLVGDDIMLGAGLKAADGDHRRVLRIDFAADQGLQRADDTTGQHDRVLGGVRIGAMAANPLYPDIDAVDIGQCKARRIADISGRCAGGIVKGQRIVGLGKTRIKPVLEHRQRALAGFFGRLQDHHQRPRPFVLARHQLPGGGDPSGHVRVVTAGVHHIGVIALPGLRLDGRGKGQPGLLLEWQAVHVGAQQHRRPLAVFHDRHDAGSTHLLGDLEAETPGLGGELGSGAHFLPAQFGMAVQITVDFHQRWQVGLDRLVQIIGMGRRNRQHRSRRQQGKFHIFAHHHPQYRLSIPD